MNENDIEKARIGAIVPFQAQGLTPRKPGEVKSLFQDPMDLLSIFNYREPFHVVKMGFDLLKRMSRNSIIASVIGTRVNQISSFCMPSRLSELGTDIEIGYRVRNKDKHPKKWSKAEHSRAKELEDILGACGITPRRDVKNSRIKRDGLINFMRKIVRDSLTYDQVCFERVFARGNKLVEWWPIDAATIRLASNNNADVSYVQVIGGTPKVTYTFDEMAFFIRNPRTDIYAKGYGFSELEQLITTITSHLYAEKYNQKAFSHGTTIEGLLNIKGQIDPETMRDFRVAWRNATHGMNAARTTPVLNSEEGIEFINTARTNKEMEFSKWIEYLIKITCAIYQIDPAEINFDISKGQTGQAPMFESSNESKLKMSKDKGLRPLLSNISTMVNEEIMEYLDPQWSFEFTGIDLRTADELLKQRTAELGSYKTLDEVREEAGLDKIGEEKGGNLILNPQYIQVLLQGALSGEQQPQPEETIEGEEFTPPSEEETGAEEDTGEEEDKNLLWE